MDDGQAVRSARGQLSTRGASRGTIDGSAPPQSQLGELVRGFTIIVIVSIAAATTARRTTMIQAIGGHHAANADAYTTTTAATATLATEGEPPTVRLGAGARGRQRAGKVAGGGGGGSCRGVEVHIGQTHWTHEGIRIRGRRHLRSCSSCSSGGWSPYARSSR